MKQSLSKSATNLVQKKLLELCQVLFVVRMFLIKCVEDESVDVTTLFGHMLLVRHILTRFVGLNLTIVLSLVFGRLDLKFDAVTWVVIIIMC